MHPEMRAVIEQKIEYKINRTLERYDIKEPEDAED